MTRRWLIVGLAEAGLCAAAWAVSLWCVGYRSARGWRVSLCHGCLEFQLSRWPAARSGGTSEGFGGFGAEWGFDFGSPYRKVRRLPLWAPLLLSLACAG